MTPVTVSQGAQDRTKWQKKPQFTLSDLFLVVAGVSVVLSAYFAHSVLAASAIALVLGVLFIVLGIRRKACFQSCLGLTLTLLALAACVVCSIVWFLFDYGPIYTRSGWPDALTQMVKTTNVNSRDVQAQGLGGFLDTEYAWKMPIPPDKLGAVLSEYDLASVPESKVTAKFFQVFPYRWGPEKKPGNLYFSTPQFSQLSRGQDGEHYFVMYDPEKEQLYVWYKFNF